MSDEEVSPESLRRDAQCAIRDARNKDSQHESILRVLLLEHGEHAEKAASQWESDRRRLEEVEKALTNIRYRGLLPGMRSWGGAVVGQWDDPAHDIGWWKHAAAKCAEKGRDLVAILEPLLSNTQEPRE